MDEIVNATKISRSVLAGLERGDVSGWPSGIFRRAFVRAYAVAVGLPPESLVAEFVQLFPDPGAEADGIVPPTPATNLRMTLAVDRQHIAAAMLGRSTAALGEAGLIVTIAGLCARSGLTGFWVACGTLALAYYTLTTVLLGRSPASWYLHGGSQALRSRRRPASGMAPDARDLLYLVKRTEQRRQEPLSAESAETVSAPPRHAASR